MIFWISVGKPKKPLGKPKNPKVSGPLRKIFGFLVSPVVTCDLLKRFLLVSTGILILKRI